MDKQEISLLKSKFDELAHVDESGVEYWSAREIMTLFGYNRWENFYNAITKALTSIQNAQIDVKYHLREVTKMLTLGKNATRSVKDFELTRYACYIVAQNGDPRKEEIAFAQSYFALQTRKQELIEERLQVIHRLEVRDRLRQSETRLSKNIYERGVDDKGFARIRSAGDAALFGKSTAAMKAQLDVSPKRPLADFLPALTIAAKNLATEMTNYNTEEKDLFGEYSITDEHIQNNKAVRGMLGKRGIKPEELPPAEDIKKVERRVKSEEKKLAKGSCFKSEHVLVDVEKDEESLG